MRDFTCDCCNTYRLREGYRLCADFCPWCQARLIQFTQRLVVISKDAKVARCRVVIQRVRDWGLDEAQVRALAKAAGWAVQPAPEKTEKKGKK